MLNEARRNSHEGAKPQLTSVIYLDDQTKYLLLTSCPAKARGLLRMMWWSELVVQKDLAVMMSQALGLIPSPETPVFRPRMSAPR